ncbi:MAG: hypothetical protein II364_03275, partial [Bacteroidales bacterium]|nr:hypothetical protein [Bacteroidales bacterium]
MHSDTVKFEGLDYGYYLITSTLGTTVTINSTSPHVVVIDKNQKPGDNFTKLVYDEDSDKWVVNSSANIGDIVDFEVSFNATNYNGEKQIQYYVIGDTKGNALWVEFNNVEVWVNNVKLERGYYHATEGTHNTNEWKYFGTWTEEEKASPDNAQWYMIHRGYDKFDIVIPWLKDHHFEGTTTDFTLTYDEDEDAESIYGSPAKVVVKYEASVEPGADIETGSNLFNTANLSWKDETIVTPPGTPTTNLAVHALGIT